MPAMFIILVIIAVVVTLGLAAFGQAAVDLRDLNERIAEIEKREKNSRRIDGLK